ncbi:DNA primase regulatory subunit PriL [Halodesulfurarchaeum sp. HSR-GB]|uniref:DNA primase regulatory subunit PriL n=1 Tax=Halodesulfurarchaeum sp. HSR-GB TaxID=3074077 RepID=UPI00286115DD|nr:DNA primase regulatory subunit PriL [Halodesulfurarchaeum sp. HSR-GB]MDR5656222.1 DNA primase regulatory subunit PriL [Halodesulfurarchaeum sp. HSR-GB]
MDAYHARYPFLRAARAAVEEAGVDLSELVRTDDAVVDRARERVERALTDREIGPASRSTRVELLSYPVARVIASLVDANIVRQRYAEAEATAARERFQADFADSEEINSVGAPSLDRETLLREFDLKSAVRRADGGFEMAVSDYLTYAASLRPSKWRLSTRVLADGWVSITADELDRLLQQAVETRVESGLPLSVPDSIATELAAAVTAIEHTLSELDLTREIDTVVPELFPPCMQHLLDRVQSGEHLAHHSRFAITSFLTNIGLQTDEIVELYRTNPGFGEEMTRYQTDHIRGDSSPTEYTAPACATMVAYGDCVNPDDLCDAISHPLSYYEVKLDDEAEDHTDWRERAEAED